MPDLHLTFRRDGPAGEVTVVAFDTEWAKHWRAVDKFDPFCAAIHVVHVPRIRRTLDIRRWRMTSELYFRATGETVDEYATAVDAMLAHHMTRGTVLVGHQLSSDLHLLRATSTRPLPMVETILDRFPRRREPVEESGCIVRDTRYDIASRTTGNGGEKLRNVSLRLRVFAVQTELDGTSLTKVYDQYRQTSDRELLERLIVMNWRHAFQTALVWIVDSCPTATITSGAGNAFLVTNDVMHEMGCHAISYLRSEAFAATRSRGGVASYVRLYAPDVAREADL